MAKHKVVQEPPVESPVKPILSDLAKERIVQIILVLFVVVAVWLVILVADLIITSWQAVHGVV